MQPAKLFSSQPPSSAPMVSRSQEQNADAAVLSQESERMLELGDAQEVDCDGDEKVKACFFKTSLCSYFRKMGSCRHALNCRFAHGEDELRPRPDGTWDPTSVQGLQIQKPKNTEDEVELEEEEGESYLHKCIRDLPLRWTSEDFKKLLTDNGLAFRSSRKRKSSPVGFVEFECDEHAISAMEKLNGLSVHSKFLKVSNASERSGEKKKTDETAANRCVDICDVVTPLAKLPYEEQLGKKRAETSQVLKKLVRNVRKAISPDASLPQWVVNAKLQGGLSCSFDGVVASPIVDGYRNKCEFTIGHSLEGKRVVGFLLGNFREGCNYVMEPDQCRNVSLVTRKYAKAFQSFIQSSELPLWDKTTNAGFWRLFTVREGRTACIPSSIAEIMLIVQVCTTGVEENIRENEYRRMAHALTLFASEAALPLSSLLIQDHVGISNAASPDAPLIPIAIPQVEGGIGETSTNAVSYIHDHICNLQFRISPTAFFQVNSSAAEKLYTMAGDWAELNSHTLLFDVCCGTGTIGLTLAHRVGMVIGIEINRAAVADACTNAEINGIKNCRFVCGKAEECMQGLLEQYAFYDEEGETNDPRAEETRGEASSKCNTIEMPSMSPTSEESATVKFKSVVVLVDPPRSGLHPVVLKLLRMHEHIRRLVYVSCNPETLLANAVELCTPSGTGDHAKGAVKKGGPWRKTAVGLARHRVKSMPTSSPFSPIKAVAVDMFPHTPHCEMIMLLER